MDLEALLALLESLGTLSDDELATLETDLRAAADSLLDGEQTEEVLADLERVADGIDRVRGESDGRADAAAERAQRAEALRDRIRGPEGEGSENGDGENADGADDAAGDGATDEAAEGAEGERTPVAAAATTPRRPTTRVSNVNARRPAVHTLALPAQPSWEGAGLTAAANVPNVTAGAPVTTRADIARAFRAASESGRGWKGSRILHAVLTAGGNPRDLFGADRYLGRDSMVNASVIDTVLAQAQAVAPTAVTAAGGVCVPTAVRYDLPTLGTAARPVRDQMMTRFGADRAGVRTMPPPVITDVTGAISMWDQATDLDPVDPDGGGPGVPGPITKPCLVITCPDEVEGLVYAIPVCLRFGNFRQRFYPEQVDSWTGLTAVAQARFAENALLTAIGAGSTQVTFAGPLGTVRDVLTGLDRLIAGMRNRHRAGDELRLRFGAPLWLLWAMRDDMAMQMPAYNTPDEALAVSEATIQGWFTQRGVNMTWFLDGETGQIMGAQADGVAVNYPATAVTYLYPEGSWLFLDGGELNLGVVRDSTLNATNDVILFQETFEGAHFHGVESLRVTFTTAPSGEAAALVDSTP